MSPGRRPNDGAYVTSNADPAIWTATAADIHAMVTRAPVALPYALYWSMWITAIDASVMDANASLRSLGSRLDGTQYREYVRRLAKQAGVDPKDEAAVSGFDKHQKDRTTSNKDWFNPHDPFAKVGRTKRGSTRMIYKPEHIVDLDTGAILDVDIRPGDEHDTDELAEHVMSMEGRLNTALGDPPNTGTIETLTGDKGYYKVGELTTLRHYGIRTVISDPIRNRCIERLAPDERAAVHATKRSARATYGKGLLRRRGEFLVRSFEHVLDCGGARRMTLRGTANIKKRYLIQAACANVSLLMRRVFGVGTPKQALAAATETIITLFAVLSGQRPTRSDPTTSFNPIVLLITELYEAVNGGSMIVAQTG